MLVFVPQRSVFHVLSSEIRLFADDTILYLFVDNPVHCDLEKMSNWASAWVVKFSQSKTKTMIINRNRKGANFPPLNMNDENLEEVQLHKHLGRGSHILEADAETNK